MICCICLFIKSAPSCVAFSTKEVPVASNVTRHLTCHGIIRCAGDLIEFEHDWLACLCIVHFHGIFMGVPGSGN